VPLPEHKEEELAVGLYQRRLITFPEGGVKLASGRISPYFVNLRPCLSFDEELDRSGQMPVDQQAQLRSTIAKEWGAVMGSIGGYYHVLGKAQGATAVGALAAYEANASYLWSDS
jgi:orotate phosphoribosyltransferase